MLATAFVKTTMNTNEQLVVLGDVAIEKELTYLNLRIEQALQAENFRKE
jgi:hypothetical protein